jgi:hypothetical protein
MKIWNWPQLGDKVWKVVSDYESGIICVFDENGNLIMKKENLSRDAIKMIEDSFLNIVANDKIDKTKEKIEEDFDSPMYA